MAVLLRSIRIPKSAIRNSQPPTLALSYPHAPSMVAPRGRRKRATMPRACSSSRNTPTVSRGGGSQGSPVSVIDSENRESKHRNDAPIAVFPR